MKHNKSLGQDKANVVWLPWYSKLKSIIIDNILSQFVQAFHAIQFYTFGLNRTPSYLRIFFTNNRSLFCKKE